MRVALCVVLAWTAAQAPAHDAATCVIRGRLTLGDTGKPAAEAILYVFGRNGGTVASSFTDPDGRFHFSVHPGLYSLAVDIRGDHTPYLTGTLGAEGTAEEGLIIRVRAGAERVIDYALKRGGVLGGRALDPDGKPLKDVVASAHPDPGDNGGAEILTRGSATTDAEGRFVITGLAPGMYRVAVFPAEEQSPDADGRVMLPTYYPQRTLPAEAQAVAIGAGDRFEDLTLTMVRGMTRSIHGRIVDPDGSPPPRRTVICEQDARESPSGTVAQTDEDGRFTADGLTPGQYECVATGRNSSAEWGSVSVDLGVDDTRDVVLQIRPGVHLSGHVVFEEKEHPVAAMRVWSTKVARGPAASYGVVRPDGAFNLIFGAVRQIEVEGVPRDWHVKAIWMNGVNAVNTIIDAQNARSPITIVLGRRMAGLTGHVVDAGETDAVLAIADNPATWTVGSSQLAVAELDEHGDFGFDHLIAGNYRLAVVAHIPSSFRKANETVLSSLLATGVPVRLVEGEVQQITLKAPGH